MRVRAKPRISAVLCFSAISRNWEEGKQLKSCNKLEWEDRSWVYWLDDVGEVHVVVNDDITVSFHERQSYEQVEVSRADVFGRPDRLPHVEDIFVFELSLEVQQEPSIWEEEVSVVATMVHGLEQVTVKDLNEGPHVREMLIHGGAMREVGRHSSHQLLETAVDHRF